MSKIQLAKSTEQLWLNLVKEGEARSKLQLDADMEHFLTQLLRHRMTDASIGNRVLALEYLQAFQTHAQNKTQLLHQVGDSCVILAGLFPKRAKRKGVSLSYFLQLGRSAYDQLSSSVERSKKGVFAKASQRLHKLIEVVQCLPNQDRLNSIDLLNMVEWYQQTGSQKALAYAKSRDQIWVYQGRYDRYRH